MLGEAIETGVFDLGDQSMTAQFRDEAAGPMSAASGLVFVGGVGGVELGLEIAVAEAIDGELAGEQGLEEGDIFRTHWVEGGDMPTGFDL